MFLDVVCWKLRLIIIELSSLHFTVHLLIVHTLLHRKPSCICINWATPLCIYTQIKSHTATSNVRMYFWLPLETRRLLWKWGVLPCLFFVRKFKIKFLLKTKIKMCFMQRRSSTSDSPDSLWRHRSCTQDVGRSPTLRLRSSRTKATVSRLICGASALSYTIGELLDLPYFYYRYSFWS